MLCAIDDLTHPRVMLLLSFYSMEQALSNDATCDIVEIVLKSMFLCRSMKAHRSTGEER